MVNNSCKILIWLIFTLIFVLASYIDFFIINCTKWRVVFFHKLKNQFLFNIPMVFISFCVLPFAMSATLEMRTFTILNSLQLNSYFIAAFIILFFFYLTIGMFAVIYAYNGKYNIKFLQLKYSPLMVPFKNNFTSKLFFPIFIFKQFVYGGIYAVLQFYATGSLGFLAFVELMVSLLYPLYLLVYPLSMHDLAIYKENKQQNLHF